MYMYVHSETAAQGMKTCVTTYMYFIIILHKLSDRLKERLDFMMRESMTESSYLNSIKAHFGYWSSQDCAQYILLQMYSYKPTNP